MCVCAGWVNGCLGISNGCVSGLGVGLSCVCGVFVCISGSRCVEGVCEWTRCGFEWCVWGVFVCISGSGCVEGVCECV